MGLLEWSLQLAVMALLLAAMPFALRLERQLRALRQDRAAMEGSAAGLAEATRLAEAASLRLRASAEAAGRQVAERLALAEPLRDDLRYLVERAEAVADRLDGLVRASRGAAPAVEPARRAPAQPALAQGALAQAAAIAAPPAAAPAAPPAATGRSQAERDLMRALLGAAAPKGRTA